jgi:5'-nucleotidase
MSAGGSGSCSDKPQSAMGHAITINNTLYLNKISKMAITEYSCSGTPVDCVKLL